VLGDQQSLVALPAEAFSFTYILDHPHPLIGYQWDRLDDAADFGEEVAPARTFATADQLRATRGVEPGPEVEALCVVVYQDRLSEQSPLPHAFARHKLLDLVGDMYLCGRPVLGQIVALKTGHEDNHALLRRLVTST
jgi:UDP-3-O-acyl-N-acetylglucosamine deacetylase